MVHFLPLFLRQGRGRARHQPHPLRQPGLPAVGRACAQVVVGRHVRHQSGRRQSRVAAACAAGPSGGVAIPRAPGLAIRATALKTGHIAAQTCVWTDHTTQPAQGFVVGGSRGKRTAKVDDKPRKSLTESLLRLPVLEGCDNAPHGEGTRPKEGQRALALRCTL